MMRLFLKIHINRKFKKIKNQSFNHYYHYLPTQSLIHIKQYPDQYSFFEIINKLILYFHFLFHYYYNQFQFDKQHNRQLRNDPDRLLLRMNNPSYNKFHYFHQIIKSLVNQNQDQIRFVEIWHFRVL